MEYVIGLLAFLGTAVAFLWQRLRAAKQRERDLIRNIEGRKNYDDAIANSHSDADPWIKRLRDDK